MAWIDRIATSAMSPETLCRAASGVITRKAIDLQAISSHGLNNFAPFKRLISRMSRSKNIIGRTYGWITVLAYGREKKWRGKIFRQWRCKCICGKELYASLTELQKRLKSCGCGKKNNRHDYQRPDARSMSIKTLFQIYRNKAKARGIAFHLNLNQFSDAILDKCYYCGSEPFEKFNVFINKATGKVGKRRTHGMSRIEDAWITWNGIDRIDSSGAYAIGNIVPCCKWCNFAKNDQAVEDFIKWAFRVRTFQRSKGNIP